MGLISPATKSEQTSVAAATSDGRLLAADSKRKAVSVFNDSASAIMYLSYGRAPASTTNFAVQAQPGGYFEVPSPMVCLEIRAIWSAAIGSARVATGS